MGEKKEIKVNLYVAVAIVLVIIFLIMGYYIFSINKSKKTLQIEKDQMKDKVSDLENQVSEYQNKIDTVMNVISNDTSSENTNKAKETNIANNTNISKTEAEKILKDKFDQLEKLYFSADIFCNIDPNITEQGRVLPKFEKSLDGKFTENMKNTIKENLPLGVSKENGKYYYSDWGGFLSFNGLVGFEDITITQDTIMAKVITKQIDADNKTLPNKITSIKIVKSGNNWLVDSFEVTRVFYGEIEEDSSNDASTNNLVGKWKPAFAKRNGEDISLRDVYGSTITEDTIGELKFEKDGTYTEFVGIYSSEIEDELQGDYTATSTAITLYTNNGKKKILVFENIDGVEYISEEKHEGNTIIMVYFKKI